MTDVITQPLPRAAALVAPGSRVVAGADAVLRLLPEYDRLARRCGLPLTAREAWITAQLDAEPTSSPWAVTVRAADGALLAAAVLLDRSATSWGGAGEVVLAGGGDGHRAGIAAVDPLAARRLAVALADALTTRLDVPVQLGPLPDDETAGWLAAALGGQIVPCDPVPWVRANQGSDVTTYLSHGMRKTLRKARNRIATDRLAASLEFTSDPDAVLRLLPDMERAFRDRDREHGLPCPLDTPEGLRLWRGRIDRLLAAGSLEAATLTLDGRLAAYVLGVRDGNRYGVLEGRFVTALSRYSPGRLLEAAVLERVVADDRFLGLDWMTGVAPETLLAANDADCTVFVCR